MYYQCFRISEEANGLVFSSEGLRSENAAHGFSEDLTRYENPLARTAPTLLRFFVGILLFFFARARSVLPRRRRRSELNIQVVRAAPQPQPYLSCRRWSCDELDRRPAGSHRHGRSIIILVVRGTRAASGDVAVGIPRRRGHRTRYLRCPHARHFSPSSDGVGGATGCDGRVPTRGSRDRDTGPVSVRVAARPLFRARRRIHRVPRAARARLRSKCIPSESLCPSSSTRRDRPTFSAPRYSLQVSDILRIMKRT